MIIDFDCGCKIDTDNFDVENVEQYEKCPKVWELLARGLTYGVFQLESPLGKSWTKRLKPENIEHLSALGAILRPSCLRSKDKNGISMTEHYCLRKNKLESVENYHLLVDNVLHTTYNTLIYQEQSMQLAKNLANFSDEESDILRRGLGHKKADVVAECKTLFLKKAKEAGKIEYNKAEEIINYIEKGNRYCFNLSHATSYGRLGLMSAVIKAHFPLDFFISWLKLSKGKQNTKEEIKSLVNEAKLMNIEVNGPQVEDCELDFYDNNKNVFFGLGNIKGVKQVLQIVSTIQNLKNKYGKGFIKIGWYKILTELLDCINKTSVEGLISVGAFKNFKFGLSRNEMLKDYKNWKLITEKEKEWLAGKKYNSLVEALRAVSPTKKNGGGTSNKNRSAILNSVLYMLENPASKTSDSPSWIINKERELLGIALSCNAEDIATVLDTNCSCKEFLSGRTGDLLIAVTVDQVKEYKTKKGDIMCFGQVSDSTTSIDNVVIFPDMWKDVKPLFIKNNNIIIQGVKSKQSSFIVHKVFQVGA